jgi:thiol:disulfide interchange protein
MLLVWAAGLLLAARVGLRVWEAGHPVAARDLVRWSAIADAEAGAARLHKPVMYDFSAAWCGPCRSMAAEVFADPAAAQFINDGFVPVHVVDRTREDGKNPPEVEALQKRFGITAFPTLVVVRVGAPVVKVEGYRGRDGTLQAIAGSAGPVRGSGRSGSGSSDRGR